MSATSTPSPRAPLEKLTRSCSTATLGDERARRIAQRYLPSREAIVEILESVLDLMYPGYFGRQDLNRDNLGAHVAQMVAALVPKLEHEMEHCLCYGREREAARGREFGECAPRAHELAQIFLQPAARDPQPADTRRAGGFRRRSCGATIWTKSSSRIRACSRSACIGSRMPCTIWACR